MMDLDERGASPVTLFKTADPLDLNCFGIAPRRVNKPFRGPDWDDERIKYSLSPASPPPYKRMQLAL